MKRFHIKAVGVTFNNSQKVIASLSIGDPLKFVLEPDNPYDCYAVKIMTLDNRMVGHVSKEYSEQIFKDIRKGTNYKVTVSNITGGGFDSNYGVNILVEC